jgi:Protein of unknown function (DUF2855)
MSLDGGVKMFSGFCVAKDDLRRWLHARRVRGHRGRWRGAAAVHRHLGDDLKHSARVGFTHWDALAPVETGLPGPAPRLFFAPDHILERRQEWGAELLAARLWEAWRGFLGYAKPARHRAYDRQGRRGANVPAGARRSHAARAGVCRVDRLAVMTLLKRRAT